MVADTNTLHHLQDLYYTLHVYSHTLQTERQFLSGFQMFLQLHSSLWRFDFLLYLLLMWKNTSLSWPVYLIKLKTHYEQFHLGCTFFPPAVSLCTRNTLETAWLDDNVYMSPSAGLRCQLAMRFFWLRHNVSFQVMKIYDFMLSRACYIQHDNDTAFLWSRCCDQHWVLTEISVVFELLVSSWYLLAAEVFFFDFVNHLLFSSQYVFLAFSFSSYTIVTRTRCNKYRSRHEHSQKV